jgi:hypothetical protein
MPTESKAEQMALVRSLKLLKSKIDQLTAEDKQDLREELQKKQQELEMALDHVNETLGLLGVKPQAAPKPVGRPKRKKRATR